jgi:hypothetical protein
MFNNKARRGPHPGPRDEIIQKLHFDEGQTKHYDVLIAKHRNDINQHQEKIADLKNRLYQLLKNPAGDPAADTLITQINLMQKEIEYIHLQHFRDIKKLCKADQQIYFDSLSGEIAQLFSPHHPDKR